MAEQSGVSCQSCFCSYFLFMQNGPISSHPTVYFHSLFDHVQLLQLLITEKEGGAFS